MGWPHRLRSQRSGEPGSEKNLAREECAQRRGNCFRWKVAAMKPKAQPCHRQDSQQDKDVQADCPRMETWPTRHPRVTASLACTLMRAWSLPATTRTERPCRSSGHILEAWHGSSISRPSCVSVNRPSSRTGNEPPASRTARFRTTCRSKPWRSVASPPIAAGRWQGRSGTCRFGCIEGRQASRGWDSPQGFPPEASAARSAVGAKA